MRPPMLPKTMRALVYRGLNHLVVEELPVPAIGNDELLVKVACCGVCPTDIKKIQYGTVPPPRVFGHETAGTIVRVGRRVRDFRVGQRVALHHHIPCRTCHACLHAAFAQCLTYKKTGITAGFEPAGGGFAEYVRVMPFVFPGVVPIPKANEFIEGAMLEPVNTVLKGVRRLGLLPGDRVWVAGQGPIGLMFTQLLQLEGVDVVASDLIPERRRLAKRFGARTVLDPAAEGFRLKLSRFAGKDGLDAVVVAVPVDQIVREGLGSVREGGKVLLFAHTKRGGELPVDLATICVDEKDLIGSYSADVTLQAEVARIVFSRKLDVRRLVSHTYSLKDGAMAVDRAAHPDAESLKLMISPDEENFRVGEKIRRA